LIALSLSLPGLVLARGSETTSAANARDADFVAGKLAIRNKDWKGAIEAFGKAVKTEPDNADIHNYLGYAYRHLGEMEQSFAQYDEALRIDPNHRGANEYIGQAYLRVNKPEKAAEHLARLEKICGRNCEEYGDLSRAIAAYNKAK
jgi:Flp pilus assembly protein TadD